MLLLWIGKLFVDLIIHLVKTFYCLVFTLSPSTEIAGVLLWFGFGAGKEDITGGGEGV